MSIGNIGSLSLDWFSNGQKLVYLSRSGDEQGIYKINSNGTNREKIITKANKGSSFGTICSLKGNLILFETLEYDNGYIINEWLWITDLEKGRTREILSSKAPSLIYYYNWSPDGSKILYTIGGYKPDSHGDHLWIINADGTNNMLISNEHNYKGFQCNPSWSPDTSKIAYVTFRGSFDEKEGLDWSTLKN